MFLDERVAMLPHAGEYRSRPGAKRLRRVGGPAHSLREAPQESVPQFLQHFSLRRTNGEPYTECGKIEPGVPCRSRLNSSKHVCGPRTAVAAWIVWCYGVSIRFEGKRYVSAILSKRVPSTRGRTLDTYVRDAQASQTAEIRAA